MNAYRRLDPHFEAPNQIKASATDRGSMVRVPIGNSRSMRVEVRSVAPDANPYLALYSIFKTGIDGTTAKIDNLRQAERYLPDHIQAAIDDFKGLEVDRGDPGFRRAGPLRRSEAGCGQSLRARAWHLRQGARSAVPPRGLQPVALESVLERTSVISPDMGNKEARPEMVARFLHLRTAGLGLVGLRFRAAGVSLHSQSATPLLLLHSYPIG